MGKFTDSTIINKINLSRIENIDSNKELQVYEVDPLSLVSSRRFDIMAKYIYGMFREKGWRSDWGYRIYEDHLWVFNNYVEDDGSGKYGKKAYINSFNSTLDSVKNSGFKDDISVIPINDENVPLDGAHRIAAALLHNKKIKVVKVNNNKVNYDFKFFAERGLRTKWSDAITLEYFKLKQEIQMIVLFDTVKNSKEIDRCIYENSNIINRKEIKLELKNDWLSQVINNLEWSKKCKENINVTDGKVDLSIYVLDTACMNNKTIFQEELQGINATQKAFVTNSKDETLQLAQLFFCENSIEFLEKTQGITMDFNRRLDIFKNLLIEKDINLNSICIVSRSVLEAYDLKTTEFLEVIHTDEIKNLDSFKDINVKNCNTNYSKNFIDNVLFNPENHFYINGFKFATLNVVNKSLKRQKKLISRTEKLLINNLSKKSVFCKKYEIYNFIKFYKILRLKVYYFKKSLSCYL
ncbi:hypothetical protein [Litchfieldia alkalitelluris]|uniref:hypothetical protein n=1 Tax=Litchfieldia alkalitelluris TaxID=304268 RepID=UPI000998A971|nr:hypothetical protein [Litchfieldia alkalitelluris]